MRASSASSRSCSTTSVRAPEEFAAAAAISDESIAAEAAADPVGYWEGKASDLDWFERWDTALDDSDPPFYKWFEGGKLNASHNCLDRHVENGLGDRVAFHWRGEEGEERDVTYADLLRDVQRLANALQGPRDRARATWSGSTCR